LPPDDLTSPGVRLWDARLAVTAAVFVPLMVVSLIGWSLFEPAWVID
jgi:hypothetical protein